MYRVKQAIIPLAIAAVVAAAGCGGGETDDDTLSVLDDAAIIALHSTMCTALKDEDVDDYMSVFSSSYPDRTALRDEMISTFELIDISTCLTTIYELSIVGGTATSGTQQDWSGAGSGSASYYTSRQIGESFAYSKSDGIWKIIDSEKKNDYIPYNFSILAPTSYELEVEEDITVEWVLMTGVYS
ncbi:MAG: hypothetical protein ABIA59_02115, partial [Candidatus Latescibacterota bacterium]